MKVLVDTPIWSYALRSKNNVYQTKIDALISLIRDQRALIIGPIRQEILSGYSDLRKYLGDGSIRNIEGMDSFFRIATNPFCAKRIPTSKNWSATSI